MVKVLVVMDVLKSVMMMEYSTLTPSLSTSGATSHIKFTTTIMCVIGSSVIRDVCEVLGRGGDTCKSFEMILYYIQQYNVKIGNPGSFPHRQCVVLCWYVEVQ